MKKVRMFKKIILMIFLVIITLSLLPGCEEHIYLKTICTHPLFVNQKLGNKFHPSQFYLAETKSNHCSLNSRREFVKSKCGKEKTSKSIRLLRKQKYEKSKRKLHCAFK